MNRVRLDALVHQRGLADSREKAKRLILAGQVLVKGQRCGQGERPGRGRCAGRDPRRAALRQPWRAEAGAGPARFSRSPRWVGWRRMWAPPRAASPIASCSMGRRACMPLMSATASSIGDLRQDARVVVMERTNARYLRAPSRADGPGDDRCLLHLAAPDTAAGQVYGWPPEGR